MDLVHFLKNILFIMFEINLITIITVEIYIYASIKCVFLFLIVKL